MQILTNHLGYLPSGKKRAIVRLDKDSDCTVQNFEVVNQTTGAVVHTGTAVPAGPVNKWKNWTFLTLDFTPVSERGVYRIQLDKDQCGCRCPSHPFEIRDGLIEETISDVLYYFRSQRCADQWNEKDKNVPVFNEDRTVDVHGGWYDASGDVSKYLSHLSYANFMNPQHTPMIVWGMFQAAADMRQRNTEKDSFAVEKQAARLFDEARYGADFLVRMQDPCGAFYMTVFDQWTADTENRMVCEYVGQDGVRHDTWQCAYRQGAGVSIAALAVAAATGTSREYDSATYLEKAIKGFDHLEANNTKYCNDGKENIIDDYCALMAATELHTASGEARFLDAACKRAQNLVDRVSSDGSYSGWLRADDGTRTFTHGAEAGLPVVALLNLHAKLGDGQLKTDILDAVKQIMKFELAVSGDVVNPFGYPRQYVTELDGSKRGSFFIAQQNETGYWWQGENARLGSLATAARYTARHVDGEFKASLEEYATNCINWMLGLNPFDVCMLQGRGFNNAMYEEGFPNAPGGMCNGITAGFTDKDNIDFNPEEPVEATTGNHRWRWGEQWIPHSGWYILAVSSQND